MIKSSRKSTQPQVVCTCLSFLCNTHTHTNAYGEVESGQLVAPVIDDYAEEIETVSGPNAMELDSHHQQLVVRLSSNDI
jgi:hypothetical protein